MNRKIGVGYIISWLFICVVMNDSFGILMIYVSDVFFMSVIYWLMNDGVMIWIVCGSSM